MIDKKVSGKIISDDQVRIPSIPGVRYISDPLWIMDIFSKSQPIGLTVFTENKINDELVKADSTGAGIYQHGGRNHKPAEQMLAALMEGEKIPAEEVRAVFDSNAVLPGIHSI